MFKISSISLHEINEDIKFLLTNLIFYVSKSLYICIFILYIFKHFILREKYLNIMLISTC